MARKAGIGELERQAARVAETMGLELVDVDVEKEPTGNYLRFYIDKPAGVTLDDCEAYHKAVRPMAEDVDFDFMEVSSPGLDRPLKKERDFERHLGDTVEVRLYKPLNGQKQLTGILVGLEAGEVLLEMDGGEILRVPQKAAALIRPVVDMEGIEEVDLSGENEMDPADPEGEENE